MPRPKPAAPVVLFELDLADDTFMVEEYPDGAFRVTMGNESLVLTADWFQQVVGGMVQIGKAKGWP